MFPGIRMEKKSAGLGVCSWEQGPCQFLPPCCHCEGKQGNAFKGISHDAIASLSLGGRGLADVCLACIRCGLPLRATCCLLSAYAVQLPFAPDENPWSMKTKELTCCSDEWSTYLICGTAQLSGNLWRGVNGICSLLVLTAPFLLSL